MDRIERGLRTGARFTPRQPPEGDFAAYVSRSVAYTAHPYKATVRLHASVEAIAELLPPDAGVLEGVDDARCMLHTGTFSLDSLSVYWALIGCDFEVVGPPELIDRVRGLAERFSRATR